MGKAAEVMTLLVSGDDGKHESRHYGTVTAIDTTNDRVTVLLDGAEATTTCDSRDVKVTIGDRVEVEIRDHKATVKANSTHPVTDDEAAEAAWAHANSAAQAASSAWTKAGEAADAAASAWSHADSALTAAGVAWDYADTAKGAADAAQADADAASLAASAAQADATAAADAASAAQESADDAKDAADRSLVQLSIVEDVAGTLTWISEHGTYVATTDTTVQEGTVYFQLVSGDYVPIASPDPAKNPQQEGWYVLDVSDSQTEYIMAHLAVTSAGLWVLPAGIGSAQDEQHANGYKVLLSSTGMTVYDGSGDAVATYGESTTFASDRDWYVGSSNAFIFYDASENAIQIGGANVTIGGLTPGQLAGSQIWTATADPTVPDYTFAISNLTGPSGVSPRVGDLVVRSYYRYTISSVGTTTVLTGNRTSIRGGTGAAGSSVTVSSVEYAYQLSTSGTTVPTGTWGSTPVAPTATQYAWTRTTTTYSDDTTAVTYTVGGKGGADGSPGTSVTISSKSVKYQASTSGTTTPTGTWLDSVPAVAQGSYLWTRTVVTYSTGDSTTAYSVARMGSDGQTGAAGPEAVVSISVTAVDFSAGTATLSASLRVNGTVTTPTSYKWTSGTSTQQIGTNEQTLSVSGTGALNATYNCTVTWSGGTQTGSIDLAATSAVKTYAAATFATQSTVSTMQAGIEANAGQIALRATKTEAYQLSQPNLTPYFSAAKADVYNATTNPTGYWSRIATNTQFSTYLMEQTHNGSGGWAHFAGNATSGEPFVRFEPVLTALKPSTTYTFLVEWDGTFSISGSVNLRLCSGTSQSDAKDPFSTTKNVRLTGTGAVASPQLVTVSTSADMSASTVLGRSYLQVNGTGAFDCYVRISLYEGEYTGPYKPYVGSQLYASQAELTVANDAISTKVEKDGVIAAINVSPETGVTIDADRVNINGAAIFTSGRLSESSLNNAYDAKGAASAVQTNLDNLQVGGRNLLTGTEALGGFVSNSESITIAGGVLTLPGTSSAWYYAHSSIIPFAKVDGSDITLSFEYKADLAANVYICTEGLASDTPKVSRTKYKDHQYDIAASSEWAKWSGTFKGMSLAYLTQGSGNVSYFRLAFYNRTDNSNLKIRFPKLERGNKATDWTPAPEDQMTATQRVYYRSATAASVAAPTTWVTANGNVWSQWTTKVPRLTQNADGSGTKYPYLYTCEQHRMGDGSIVCTAVLLDENTTVIDGGSIITNSITANKLQANSLTLGYINQSDAATAAALLNSNVVVGGKNLLLWTGRLPKGTDNSVNGKDGIAAWGSALSLLTETPDGIKLTAANNGQECIGVPLANNGSVGNDEDVMLSFEARGNITSVGQFYWLQASGANVAITNWLNGSSSISLSETTWTRFTTNVKSASANVRTCTRILMFYALGSANSGKWIEIRKGTLKLEKGNRATDWTPAPEDQTTYIDTSLAESVGSITTTIDTEVDTLTDSITGVSNSLATLGVKVDGLVQKAAALEKKTQWVKWDDTEGMIFGENGTAFNTRLKAENMTFNYGNQTMMTLSTTNGVDAPKVRTQRLELGNDWAITISGDMFAIDYIGS